MIDRQTDRQTDRQMKFTLRSLERGSLTLAPIIICERLACETSWLVAVQYEGAIRADPDK